MKTIPILLGAMLCMGTVQMSISHMSQAQPASLSYDKLLAMGKQDFAKKDFDSAAYEARELLKMARSPREKGISLNLLGETLYRLGDYDQAREQWNQLLKLSRTDDGESSDAFAHFGLARSYSAQQSYDLAIPHYQAFLKIAQKNGATEEATYAFSLALADAFYNTHQNDLAQEQLNRVLLVTQSFPPFLAFALVRAGEVNTDQRRFRQASANYQQALQTPGIDPSLKQFAARQIAMLYKLKDAQLGVGERNEAVPIDFEHDVEFDQKLSQMSLELIDKVAVDETLIKRLGE